MDENIKTVIITGGAQGIGKCTALTLLEKGYNVSAADIDDEALVELRKDAGILEKNLFAVHADAALEDDVKRVIDGTIKKFGGIYGIINNSGIGINKPVTELSVEEWNRVIGVNLTSAFLTSKHAAPYLKKSLGIIINTASTRAFMSEPDTEAYSATKGGILSLTHALAISLGPEIRVNCISPGWIEVSDWKKISVRKEPVHTEADRMQHPAGRVGKPQDIASMVVYLLSDESGFITGQNFTIDGGMTKKMIYV
jgi:NAD(P)-dependent dehydrogenase (short-subunit alcohol dehydrogenase family)